MCCYGTGGKFVYELSDTDWHRLFLQNFRSKIQIAIPKMWQVCHINYLFLSGSAAVQIEVVHVAGRYVSVIVSILRRRLLMSLSHLQRQ